MEQEFVNRGVEIQSCVAGGHWCSEGNEEEKSIDMAKPPQSERKLLVTESVLEKAKDKSKRK